ncbi:MAG TPA: hypothetical protein VFV19_13470 [Candidatus Polarisedimenticolaceae bacterium]|nr:hypothetical protein [Candidatus Polarisedimenticolaceae bacterium]
MQSRILAGCKSLIMAAAIAALVAPSAFAASGMKANDANAKPKADAGHAGTSATPDGLPATNSKGVYFARSNYVWPFASGPVYGDVAASRWRSAGVLHSIIGSFDLTAGMPRFPSQLVTPNRLTELGKQYFLLQVQPEVFTNGVFDQMKAAISAQGGAIVGEMPVGAFIVRMTPAAYDAVRGFGSVIILEPYHAAFKLSPDIGRNPLLDPIKAVSSTYSLAMRVFPGESTQAVAATIQAMGLTVKKFDEVTLYVDADRSKLAALAGIDAVQNIWENLPLLVQSEETTTTIQTGRWNNGATPYTDAGVDGGGSDKASFADDQLLLVLDDGIQLDAGDLSNTRTDGASTTPVGSTHRKVQYYASTNQFGGDGDLLGCDNTSTSGFTHGHMVAAIALGNATRVPASYGQGWQALDTQGNPWDLDGIAPKARLIAYDAGVTPASGNCIDPNLGSLDPGGTIYISPAGGVLGDGYSKGAKIVNFSFATSSANTYTGMPQAIDQFLAEKGDALVFVAAGNYGKDASPVDQIPDAGTLATPATFKNGIAVGACANANDQFNINQPNIRTNVSGVGPATVTSGRIQPLLMAPGTDAVGGMGFVSEFVCRSNDNDQNNPVECDIKENPGASTSWSTAAASGAALLVRDYFAQGFYPDGTASNPGNAADKVANISGDLVKAILVNSAQFMSTGTLNAQGQLDVGSQILTGLTQKARFNREQGYGRINLSRALPLQSYSGAVSGLIVDDGGMVPAGGLIHSTNLNMNISPGSDSGVYSLNVCDNTQPLTISIAWMDPSNASDSLSRDLNLVVTAPNGKQYYGNFFTDDANGNGVIDGTEDCVYTGEAFPPDSVAGVVDVGPWSLPVNSCTDPTQHVDHANPIEAVFLSPDTKLNGIVDDPNTGIDESADNQIQLGTWSVQVFAPGTNAGPVNYAIAMSGGVCQGSSVRLEKAVANSQTQTGGTFACNDSAQAEVSEFATAGDPAVGLTTAKISSRFKFQVVDPGPDGTVGTADDVVTDTESNIAFTDADGAGVGLRFDSAKLLITDGTAPDPGNGVLDVRSGQVIQAVYQDQEPDGTNQPNLRRVAQAAVDCRPAINAGGIVFAQFGQDAFTLVSGGCEKDARGYFTFGFPDRYMDAGELVGYSIAFQSAETTATLTNVTVSLKAVSIDADSPADCKPRSSGTQACADPTRSNNPVSPYLTILDSPKVLGTLPPGATITPTFQIQVANVISGVQKADMILGVSAKSAGRAVESVAVQRETLNADEVSFYYSTDFPTGGSETVGGYDINNNEVLEPVTNSVNNFLLDYIFETRSYSDSTVGGFNTVATLKAPWNFDTNDGGFRSGINSRSFNGQGITIAFWGEDKNFNGRLDGLCNGDPRRACTDDNGISEGCFRCANDPNRPCFTTADCVGVTTCDSKGTCDFTLDEDRDEANGVLDEGWNTAGGCGWQTKVPGDPLGYPSGGVWHTGTIGSGDPNAGLACIGAGVSSSRCQAYERFPLASPATASTWWELLLTPVVNKVNQCPTANGTNCLTADAPNDPVYQVAITDWAWNMAIDLADQDTAITAEFDTDIDKLQGAEFYNDLTLTNIRIFGNQGAISDGNAPITGGFNIFAPISKCIDTDGVGTCSVTTSTLCAIDSDCPAGQTCTNYLDHCGTVTGTSCQAAQNDTPCTGLSRNGTAGNNREALNNCYFEGKITPDKDKALLPYGLPTPDDDDQQNSWCHRSDSLDGIDKSVTCNPNAALPDARCKAAAAPYTTCAAPTATIDQFVQKNGPGRNYGVKVPNGPDMRFTTLEDFYGQTGKRFQAAFGFRNFEATASSPVAPNSYGVAVDDMVISWKETRLDEDTHTCAGSGECADIEVKSTLSYDANNLVEVTVTDKSPYDPVHPVNDCNRNGTFTDTGLCNGTGPVCSNDAGCSAGQHCVGADDTDCNDNGIPDVTVVLTSDAEVNGELAVLDQVSPNVYKTRFPYSVVYNSPGTLYVAVSGTAAPVITARYEDRDDGTGSRCKSSLDPTQQGFLTANTTVNVTSGRIDLKTYQILLVGTVPTNGDNDGFADTNETIDMPVTFVNKSGLALDDLTATLGTSDPNIECISKPVVTVPAVPGTVANNATVVSAPFRFKVANVNRTSVDQNLKATFNLTLHSRQFDAITRSMTLTIDLDLSTSGGSGPLEFVEDFTSTANMGKFTISTLDAGKNSLSNSFGMRCQYNDPDGLNTNSAGDKDCFLGFTGDPAAGVNDWHVHDSSAANGGLGRAYTGNFSVHWGVHLGTTPKRDTGRFKQLDAIQTINAVALGLASSNPELNFAHQVSLVDNRGIGNITNGECADRAVVQVNVLNSAGAPTTWVKIFPYENVYEQQGTDDFTNCEFDPTDDGNNEESFFNPTDPARRLGPSSTCFPEFVFSRSGDTDYRNTWDPTHVGLADANAGLKGSINVGTWVRPRFSLLPYAARRIRLRFLGTSIELGSSQTWDAFFGRDDQVQDDGWYIDDVHIVGALGGTPFTITQDTKVITPLATCGTCSSITAALVATPATTAGPGQPTSLEAKTSTIDVCLNGVTQYQFWQDTNNNSIVGDAGDTLLRDWTDSSTFADAPQVNTQYGVKVRCSTNVNCDQADGSAAKVALVTVPCPSSGTAKAKFTQSIGVSKTAVSWATTTPADAIRGDLIALRANGGNFNTTVLACIGNDVNVSSIADATNPGVAAAFYYLVRPSVATYCNQVALSWREGVPSELPGAGGDRDADLTGAANVCP